MLMFGPMFGNAKNPDEFTPRQRSYWTTFQTTRLTLRSPSDSEKGVFQLPTHGRVLVFFFSGDGNMMIETLGYKMVYKIWLNISIHLMVSANRELDARRALFILFMDDSVWRLNVDKAPDFQNRSRKRFITRLTI